MSKQNIESELQNAQLSESRSKLSSKIYRNIYLELKFQSVGGNNIMQS